MIIFGYMVLLLAAGIGVRVYQIATATFDFGLPHVLEEVLTLSFTYFGMIGLWGYAKKRQYFSNGVWKAYFYILLAALPLPLLSPKYQEVAAQHGNVAMWTAYLMSTLLAAPMIWAIFSYAFRKKEIWASA